MWVHCQSATAARQGEVSSNNCQLATDDCSIVILPRPCPFQPQLAGLNQEDEEKEEEKAPEEMDCVIDLGTLPACPKNRRRPTFKKQ